jgi:hypothetical protein
VKVGRKAEAKEEVEAALKSGRTFDYATEAGQLLQSLK